MSDILYLVGLFINLYSFVILARVLLSWAPNVDYYHPAIQMLYQLTDPVLEPARRLIPPIGMVDISPTIVLFVLWFLASTLMGGRG